MDMALRVKRIMSLYQQNQDLISVGAYARGSNPQIDEAIRLQPALTQLLSQKPHESVGMEQSLRDMIMLFNH
jgi:flagellum-specific ATP synthase